MIRKEAWKSFLKYVADGLSVTDAATNSRINRATFYLRYQKDPEFAAAFERAAIATKTDAIETIKKAWKNQWQAAGWWLERRHSDEFALKSQPMVSLTFKQNDKLRPLDNEKLIEVTIDNPEPSQIESKPS